MRSAVGSGLALVVLFISLHFLSVALPTGIGICSGAPHALHVGRSDDATEFFVSPLGNDRWSGRFDHPNAAHTDGPFRTLARARDAVRELKAAGPLRTPVKVIIRGGTYQLDGPLIFTPQDSGTESDPIIYEAYPGETPVLSGGQMITGWRRTAGAELSSPAKNHLWVADVPAAKDGWYFHQLFIDGKRMSRARTPNQGFYYVDGQISDTTPARFKFHDHDIRPEWGREGDVEVVALQNWAELRVPIKSVDDLSHTVTLAGRRQPYAETDARYWIENAPDALDAPGEWYLDRRSARVYFYPYPGEDMSTVRVVASRLMRLIRFEGDAAQGRFVSYIEFRGLTFSYTDWTLPPEGYADLQAAVDVPAAVAGEGARFCTIEKCRFIHLGGYAVSFAKGSQNDRIARSEMTDLGAGGVKIGDRKIPVGEQNETRDNAVTDNHIHNIGSVYPAAVGVWIGQSSGNVVAHNEINDTYYTAISVGWTWGYGPTAAKDNLIEFNSLHDIGRGMLSDMGCIYTLGVQPGTVERNNICHDVSRYKYGGWGIYTDEGSSHILVENNIVYRCEDGGFHQHYGEANVVRNNIFALGDTAQLRRTREENHLSFTFTHNIVYWKDGELLDGKWDDNNFRFENNLYYSVAGGPVEFAKWSFREWQGRGQDVGSLIANPLLVNPEQGDFSLEAGSPALKIGFMPIDVSTVGPRRADAHQAACIENHGEHHY